MVQLGEKNDDKKTRHRQPLLPTGLFAHGRGRSKITAKPKLSRRGATKKGPQRCFTHGVFFLLEACATGLSARAGIYLCLKKDE